MLLAGTEQMHSIDKKRAVSRRNSPDKLVLCRIECNSSYAKAAFLRRYYPDQVRGVFREIPKSQAQASPSDTQLPDSGACNKDATAESLISSRSSQWPVVNKNKELNGTYLSLPVNS